MKKKRLNKYASDAPESPSLQNPKTRRAKRLGDTKKFEIDRLLGISKKSRKGRQ